MPIFKNSLDIYNTAVTIKRTPKDVAVTRYRDDWYFRYYRQMNNRAIKMRWYHGLGESVIIRCEIEANAEGYIYGNTSGANIFVYKNGSTHKIQWRNGTTVLKEIDCDDKRHEIGFMGVIPDLGSFSGRKMYPFYDGTTFTNEFSTSVSAALAFVGGAIDGNTNPPCIHSSGTWAIRVYEVYARSFYYQDMLSLNTFDMYPAAYTVSADDCVMIDIRDSLDNASTVNGSAAGGTSSSSAANFPQEGYGVQLHDVKFITDSGYDNIIPMLAEDKGVDTDAGFTEDGTAAGQADYPASLTQSTDVRKFAISVKDLPRPSGWTYAEFNPSISGGFNYDAGELHHGRTPKWSIWNDAIDFGFLVDANGRMRFNMLKRMVTSGQDSGSPAFCKVKTIGAPLQYFDNYNTDVNCFHAPFIRFDNDTLKVNIHNGAMVRTENEDINGGSLTAATIFGHPARDNEVVYVLNETLGGKVSYRLGNLAPWNRSYDDMSLIGWMPQGVKLTLTLTESGSDVFVETKEHKQTSSPYLTSGATTAVKNEYRINGWSEDLVPTSNPERKWRLLDYIMNYTESNPMPLWAKMSMIVGASAINNLVDCSYLVAPKKCSLYPAFDMKIDGTSGVSQRDENWNSDSQEWREGWINADAPNYRAILKPEGNLNICNVYGCNFTTNYLNENYSPLMQTRFDYNRGTGGALQIFTTLSMPIIGCTTNSSGAITALDSAATDYMGVVELFYYANNNYNYAATVKQSITKTALEASAGSDLSKWYGQFTASTWAGNALNRPYALWKNGQRQFGYYTSTTASTILDDPQNCNVEAYNSTSGHLFDKVRFLAVNGYDFNISRGPNNFALPKDATAIFHVFNKNTSPVFVVYDNALWDATHHHVIFPDCGETISSQRTYEMADSWMQFTPSSGSVTLELYFRSFTRSGSNYVVASPVMVPNVTSSNNSGKIYIERYNQNGVLQSTTEDYVYNLLSKSGSTPLTYTKQILGLDGVIYDDCYRLQKTFSGVQTGDYFKVRIS